MPLLSSVAAVATAVGKALGLIEKETDLKNAPDVKAAAVAKSEDQERAKDIQAVQSQDIEEVRRRCSE